MKKWMTLLSIGFTTTLMGIEVRLVDQVAVRAPTITLGEIAVIDTHDLTLRDQLKDLELGPVPALGRNRVISAFKIRSALSKANLSHVKLFGLQTSIYTEAEKLSSEVIKATVNQWITTQVGPSKEAEVDFLQGAKEWAIPAGGNHQIDIEAGRQKLAGAVTLTLTVRSDDKVLATRRVRAKIALHQETAVIVRPVLRGQPVEAGQIEMRRAEVTDATGMEIAHLEDIMGMVATRNLPVGHVASAKDFDQPTLIERGSLNRILVINGAVQMAITGAEALQSGKKGDTVLFSNPVNGRETLKARVERPGLAIMKMQ